MEFSNELNIYFVGIGGISMSALAVYLHDCGFKVSGYDKTPSKITKELEKKGIKINNPLCLFNCDLAVVSSAISSTDEQIITLNKFKKPIISRSCLLKQIASTFKLKVGIAGTHGKTTSTAICAHILKSANKAFTAHIGGLDNKFLNLANFGGDIFLTEVCEFKKNIANFTGDISALLNVSSDHLESYGNFKNLQNEFCSYLHRANRAVCDYDLLNIAPKNALTFSLNNRRAHFFASDIKFYNNCIEYAVNQPIGALFRVKLNSLYLHDVKNSLAAIAISHLLKVSQQDIVKGISSFSGIKRRSEIMGKINNCTIFADYAHHPDQLKSAISMLNYKNLNYAVFFQSHTYSRTNLLFNQFTAQLRLCKNLFIFNTYGAREKYDYKGSGKRLSEEIEGAVYCGDITNAQTLLRGVSTKFEFIAILGAGDLYDQVESFLKESKN